MALAQTSAFDGFWCQGEHVGLCNTIKERLQVTNQSSQIQSNDQGAPSDMISGLIYSNWSVVQCGR
jgi:hypothetical protein